MKSAERMDASLLKGSAGKTINSGRVITNATFDNIWFRDNVFMIFSTGCIYDEEDSELLTQSLAYFKESSRVAFLDNKILVLDHNEPSHSRD